MSGGAQALICPPPPYHVAPPPMPVSRSLDMAVTVGRFQDGSGDAKVTIIIWLPPPPLSPLPPSRSLTPKGVPAAPATAAVTRTHSSSPTASATTMLTPWTRREPENPRPLQQQQQQQQQLLRLQPSSRAAPIPYAHQSHPRCRRLPPLRLPILPSFPLHCRPRSRRVTPPGGHGVGCPSAEEPRQSGHAAVHAAVQPAWEAPAVPPRATAAKRPGWWVWGWWVSSPPPP